MKKFFLILFFSSLSSLSASDHIPPQKQQDEMDKALTKARLYTQAEINSQVAHIAIETYKAINENWTYVQENEKGSIESRYWQCEALTVRSGQRVPTLVFQGEDVPQLLPALKDIIKYKACVECTLAGKTARNIALAEILGKNSFEAYVDGLLVDKKLKLSSLELYQVLPYGKSVGGALFYQSTWKREKGHFTYIKNIPDYLRIVKGGASQGENVVCVGNNQYIGFGERFKTGPLSEEQIAEGFYAELEKYPAFREKYPTKDFYFKARFEYQKAFDASSQYGYFNADLINEFLYGNGESED